MAPYGQQIPVEADTIEYLTASDAEATGFLQQSIRHARAPETLALYQHTRDGDGDVYGHQIRDIDEHANHGNGKMLDTRPVQHRSI